MELTVNGLSHRMDFSGREVVTYLYSTVKWNEVNDGDANVCILHTLDCSAVYTSTRPIKTTEEKIHFPSHVSQMCTKKCGEIYHLSVLCVIFFKFLPLESFRAHFLRSSHGPTMNEMVGRDPNIEKL